MIIQNSGDSLAGIYVEWNAISELYNSYTAYSVSYQGFDKHSISTLASATEKYKEYIERPDEEKAIASANGIAADFAAVIEHEFIKIIKELTGIEEWTFFNAINEFKSMIDYNSAALFALTDNINELHFIRKLHNDIDHGNRLITDDELDKLYDVTILHDMCKLLSFAYLDFIK